MIPKITISPGEALLIGYMLGKRDGVRMVRDEDMTLLEADTEIVRLTNLVANELERV